MGRLCYAFRKGVLFSILIAAALDFHLARRKRGGVRLGAISWSGYMLWTALVLHACERFLVFYFQVVVAILCAFLAMKSQVELRH